MGKEDTNELLRIAGGGEYKGSNPKGVLRLLRSFCSQDAVAMPFLISFPQTEQQLADLRKFHGSFFGICYYCKGAGHVDQLVAIPNEDWVEVCGDCIQRLRASGEICSKCNMVATHTDGINFYCNFCSGING